MEETQTLCIEEIEIKTDMELSSCSSEKDEKADTGYQVNEFCYVSFLLYFNVTFWALDPEHAIGPN
jgi:hypothetical protein